MKTRTSIFLFSLTLLEISRSLFAMPSLVTSTGILSANDEKKSIEELTSTRGSEGDSQGNTYYGTGAGANLSETGFYNAFFGYNSGLTTTGGDNNTFVGYQAGLYNLSGGDNTFLGSYTGRGNITGSTGSSNTLVGSTAGYQNRSGGNNTFLGNAAGYNNTSGSANTFLGRRAGYGNTNGFYNTYLGLHSGYSNSTGDYNTFVGYFAGYDNTAGAANVFLGAQAGRHEEGSYKLYIHPSSSTNPLIYGEFDNRSVFINGDFGATAISVSSDKRWKKNIQRLGSSLSKVLKLEGVSYDWKVDEYPDRGLSKKRQIGLVAQNVESVLPELVQTDTNGYKLVSYDKLTVVLVEAIREQQNQIEEQKAQIDNLLKVVEELSRRSN